MTNRYLATTKTAWIALAILAVICFPLSSAFAQTTLGEQSASGTLSARDGSESLNGPQEEGRMVRPRTYPRANYIWPYSFGPNYPRVNVNEQGVLWTPAGAFQLQNPLPIATELRSLSKLDVQAAQYFVVQYNDEITDVQDLQTTIERNGGKIISSPSSGSVVALMTSPTHDAAGSAFGVIAVEPYHGAFKLDPKIGRTPLADPIRALSDVYTLEVGLWDGEDLAATAAAITGLGGTVVKTFGNDTIIVDLHRSLLPLLAALDPVQTVNESLPRFMHGEETTTTMQTGQYNAGAIPYHDGGVDGGGLNRCSNNLTQPCTVATEGGDCGGPGLCLGPQVVMVLDSGFQLDAGDLSDERTDAGLPGLAHRKVRVHRQTNDFGGSGDLEGCDAPPQGGFTHGHVVSGGLLGWATDVDVSYGGPGWVAFDQQGNPWKVDGVAPRAVLVAYDGQITPPNGSCQDPLLATISPGDLYDDGAPANGPCPSATNCPGALGKTYEANGARIFNFSWGVPSNSYNTDAADIDNFMEDKRDALVFVSAGNQGRDIQPPNGDGIPDTETLGAPATTKNGFAIGASRNANTVNSPESREAFSSMGPAINTTVNRIAPQLMAPGGEPGAGSLGISSEFTCRTNDNNQTNPVACDIISGAEGTSFSSPAAAGAGTLVRDYFESGYHPDAVEDANDHFKPGAALVKAVLIASADYMSGVNLTIGHRWNNEQGYGRIQLDQALPLEVWPDSPTGMLVHDAFAAKTDLGLPFTVATGQSHSTTFNVTGTEELRIALAWVDDADAGSSLRNDLDLWIVSPSGLEYRGNYFTDDNDQDGVPEAGEDCAGLNGIDPNTGNAIIDSDQWSLPVCDNSRVLGKAFFPRPFDNSNPTEAIFLSPDPTGDDDPETGDPQPGACTPTSSANANGPCANNLDCRASLPGVMGDGECNHEGDYQQIELGEWELHVDSGPGTIVGAQEFSVAVVGGVSLGSVVRFDKGVYPCNDDVVVTVNELVDIGAGGTDIPTEAAVSTRTTVQVIAPVCSGDGVTPCDDDLDCSSKEVCGLVVDEEDGFNFTKDPAGLKFDSDPIQMTDGTARDFGNGILDIRHNDTLRVEYTDADVETGGLPLTVIRQNFASLSCTVDIGFGSIVFAQFGQNSSLLIQGGCERNLRDQFEFGFPDRYMDAGENIILNFAFNSNESVDLDSVVAEMSCVQTDADSPASCLPSGAGCLEGTAPPEGCGPTCDPLRTNNPACVELTILDSPNNIGFVPSGAAMSANFTIQMAGDGDGEPFESTLCADGTTPCDVSSEVGDCGGVGLCSLGQPTPAVELILNVKADISGQSEAGLAISRQVLNVDSVSTFYSTDYPDGGTEVVDYGPGVAGNNDEVASNPIFENANFQSNDYRFETFVFAPLNSGGKNANLLSPWDFDTNNGGFAVGLAAPSDETAADGFNIHNWGEDKNFNNVEDGVCLDDEAISCYIFGTGTDARCPTPTSVCQSRENNGQDAVPAFTSNWNTKGGCGWQTRTTGECSGDATRGCADNDDCLGTCHLIGNEIASTLDTCTGTCPDVGLCNSASDNVLDECTIGGTTCGLGGTCTDFVCVGGPNVGQACDCLGGGFPGPSCIANSQTCVDFDGTCAAPSGNHTGGVWHSGPIGDKGGACDGSEASACANYKVVGGGGSTLLWWELLTTPVMEKVNQDIDPETGLPETSIEIFDWGWNTQINLIDSNASYSWELDTDIETLDPVDLFSDTSILNIGGGSYGAVSLGSNPDLTNGWPVFAPQASCTTAPFGTCRSLFECSPGACNVSTNSCHVDADCDPGACSVSTGVSCFANGDCPQGACSVTGGGCNVSAECPAGQCSVTGSIGCNVDTDCPDGTCTGAGMETCRDDTDCPAIETCTNPAPETCAGAPETCVGGETCTNPAPEGCGGAPQCDTSGLSSTNGLIGGNREGEAGCFFEGGGINNDAFIDLGTAHPRDDDLDNDLDGRENGLGACAVDDAPCNSDGDCNSGFCVGRCATGGTACSLPGDCTGGSAPPCLLLSSAYDCTGGADDDGDGLIDMADPDCASWTDLSGEAHGVDEFVSETGPYRNHDIVAFNGPDMRFGTLEDIYGDTGNNFQAAIGFVTAEGTLSSIAKQSYGMSLDDMVVKWREFSLESDETDCADSGSCAVVEVGTTGVFEGQTVIKVTVIDPVHDVENDCTLTGVASGTVDCNVPPDGVRDVVIKATSEAETTGELVILNETGTGTDEYKGSLTVSSLSDSPGVLYLAQEGTDAPTITVTYLDNDIDPATPAIATCSVDADCAPNGSQNDCNLGYCGEECPNDVDPSKHGLVQTFTGVALGTTCEVTVVGTNITDNGDGDEFADTEESLTMEICLINNCNAPLNNCTGRLFSNSSTVDCILDSTIDVGFLDDVEDIICVTDRFEWKVADVQRASATENLLAEFNFTMTCDEIDGLSAGQDFALSLDLDLDDQNQTSSNWTEGFEGSLGKFEVQNLDFGIPGQNNTEGHINGDGWRCQYSDPDWVNSNSYGNEIGEDCFPGATLAAANASYWDIDGDSTGSPDGGRAKTGSSSAYYGIYLTDPPSEFTTPLAIVEAMKVSDPINLGVGNPILSWWHQLSLMDGRSLNVATLRSADRGKVQYREVDGGGSEFGTWITLEPFQNTYDTQNYDFYFNCMFDPVDDGDTEDNFFDPTDPQRRLGPSSTCHPNFAWSCMGDTALPFAVANTCNGTTEPLPGDAGILGTGTWVESKVDLTALKGRRIKVRYLVAGIKASAETHDEQFDSVNPGDGDNGWWIDDVLVDDTLSLPALLLVDNDVVMSCDNGAGLVGCLTDQDCVDASAPTPCAGDAPGCGAGCTTATVSIATTPDLTGGTQDELLTAPGQPIEIDASGSSGVCLDGSLLYRFSKGGAVIREYSENASIIQAPTSDTDYLVEVRCSTDASCDTSALVDVNVTCPTSGNLVGNFPTVFADESDGTAADKNTWSWDGTSGPYKLHKGNLPVTGAYAGASTDQVGSSFLDTAVPTSGAAFYYLTRWDDACNSGGPWDGGGAAGRDGVLP